MALGQNQVSGQLSTNTYTVSHFSYATLFQRPQSLPKMLESNTLYDNLLIDILSVWWHRTKYRNHSCESFCFVKVNFDKNARATWTSIFSILVLIVVTEKTPITNIVISVVEFSYTVTFWRNARFDVILTSVTIIKQVFLRKLFCYESLVDIEVSKH